MCYSLTLLVLNTRRNTLFQHGVNLLRRFLNAERLEDSLIDRAVAHFRYWWLRYSNVIIFFYRNMPSCHRVRVCLYKRRLLLRFLFGGMVFYCFDNKSKIEQRVGYLLSYLVFTHKKKLFLFRFLTY